MKSTIEELGPTRVRMAIEVPWGDLDHAFGEVYKELGKQVRVPGFRPGKVPNRVLDQRIGRPVVLEQVVQHAVPEVYSEVVRENQVRVLGQPDIEVTRLDDNDTLAFTAEVDVAPKLELPVAGRPRGHRRRRRGHRRGDRPAGRRHARALRACSPASSAPPRTATSCRSTSRPPSTARCSRTAPPAACPTRSAPATSWRAWTTPSAGCPPTSRRPSRRRCSPARTPARRPRSPSPSARSRPRSSPSSTTTSPPPRASSTPSPSCATTSAPGWRRTKTLGQGAQARDKLVEHLSRPSRCRCPETLVEREIEWRNRAFEQELQNAGMDWDTFLQISGGQTARTTTPSSARTSRRRSRRSSSSTRSPTPVRSPSTTTTSRRRSSPRRSATG